MIAELPAPPAFPVAPPRLTAAPEPWEAQIAEAEAAAGEQDYVRALMLLDAVTSFAPSGAS